MLIPFNKIVEKYDIKPTGIIHAGAHTAEELEAYLSAGFTKVIWIEANPELEDVLLSRIKNHRGKMFVEIACIGEETGREVSFKITNNKQSSSVLNLAHHATQYPHIVVSEEVKMKTRTLAEIVGKYDFLKYKFLNMDLQGYELHALKGLGQLLHNIDYVYTEINLTSLYEGCVLFEDLKNYLEGFDFELVEKDVTPGTWGDAFFVKKWKVG